MRIARNRGANRNRAADLRTARTAATLSMPELPEVEAIARTIEPLIAGRKILATRLPHPIVARNSARDIEGPRSLARARGRKVIAVHRRGKYLLVELDRGWLAFHFRLSGQFVWYRRSRRPEHVDFELDFGNGTLGFVDERHLGRVRRLNQPEDLPGIARMGIDPLSRDFTAQRLGGVLRDSRRPVKLVLMDQENIAGLGNIWAAESLWQARIDPRRRANTLNGVETRHLARSVARVLRRALESCLDPAPDIRNPEWWFENGDKMARVYGREGRRCPRCGAAVRRVEQGGRSTYFCPGCQR
jgi:formamidopyrimidine-DNA glycosylase